MEHLMEHLGSVKAQTHGRVHMAARTWPHAARMGAQQRSSSGAAAAEQQQRSSSSVLVQWERRHVGTDHADVYTAVDLHAPMPLHRHGSGASRQPGRSMPPSDC